MSYPSIQSATEQHHRYCEGTEGGWLGDMAPEYDSRGRMVSRVDPNEGDVRKCIHGAYMVAYPVAGSGGCYWRTLHWLFNPIQWRRAKREWAKNGHVRRLIWSYDRQNNPK
jgi:hypothetical protein